MTIIPRLSPARAVLLPKELLLSYLTSNNYCSRNFSVLNRPAPNYPGHIPLNRVEQVGLAIGSAVGSLVDVRRHGTLSDYSQFCTKATDAAIQISLLLAAKQQPHRILSIVSAMPCYPPQQVGEYFVTARASHQRPCRLHTFARFPRTQLAQHMLLG